MVLEGIRTQLSGWNFELLVRYWINKLLCDEKNLCSEKVTSIYTFFDQEPTRGSVRAQTCAACRDGESVIGSTAKVHFVIRSQVLDLFRRRIADKLIADCISPRSSLQLASWVCWMLQNRISAPHTGLWCIVPLVKYSILVTSLLS